MQRSGSSENPVMQKSRHTPVNASAGAGNLSAFAREVNPGWALSAPDAWYVTLSQSGAGAEASLHHEHVDRIAGAGLAVEGRAPLRAVLLRGEIEAELDRLWRADVRL